MNEILLKPSAELLEVLEYLNLCGSEILKKDSKNMLTFSCLNDLYKTFNSINKKSDIINVSKFMYLHQWISSCDLQYPTPSTPVRNPILEARIQRLRLEQEEREYKKMTGNMHKGSANDAEAFSLGTEIRSLRSQMFAVMNFLLTVGGTFMFGYKAVEYSADVTSIPMQIMVGFIMATIVAVAELYFVAKII